MLIKKSFNCYLDLRSKLTYFMSEEFMSVIFVSRFHLFTVICSNWNLLGAMAWFSRAAYLIIYMTVPDFAYELIVLVHTYIRENLLLRTSKNSLCKALAPPLVSTSYLCFNQYIYELLYLAYVGLDIIVLLLCNQFSL